jgi:phospholipid/cholesterol/gamma-HCH transport system ATP-binding protein
MTDARSEMPVIECRDLVCGYDGLKILEDVNIEVRRGEITALLGGSGSGKSTLLKTIVGLLEPLAGEVRLLGENIYGMSPRQRSSVLKRTGMLYQYGALFGSRTIYDNISLPLRQHTNLSEPVMREMVRQRLALMGLEGLEFRLPADVSGGQRKRVALARATIMDPEIVFADEPSAGLDPVVAAGLDELLRQMQRLFGSTMVVVTHELPSIEILADRVVMLAEGRVRAVGTVEEMRRSNDEIVYNFFHRVAPNYVAAEDNHESVLDSVTDVQS